MMGIKLNLERNLKIFFQIFYLYLIQIFFCQSKKGKLNFWGDLSFSNGYGSQSDVWGTQLMPFYDFTDKIQGVFSYTYVESKDALDVDVTRYERDLAGRGDEMKEYFFGVNYFFYGHKLKWQNAIQYSEMDNLGTKVYEGWGYTSGLRISW